MDASDRRSIREAEKVAAIAERSNGEVLAALAGSPLGRRWLWERLDRAHVFASVFADSPTRMAFLEGERNQGLQLLNDVMRFCPDQFILMMREANARRSEDAIRAEHAAARERSSNEEPGRVDEGPDGSVSAAIDAAARSIADLYVEDRGADGNAEGT